MFERSYLLILSALALAACASNRIEKVAKDPALAPPVGMENPSPPDEAVIYTCESGVKFKAVFSDNNGSVRIELQTGAPLTLYIAATGSGFAYMDGGHELRGKGDEAMWSDGKSPATKCMATPTG